MHFMLARVHSVGCALAGIVHLVRTQRNAWIHILATCVVVALAATLRLSLPEWCWLLLATGAVWVAEALNTAVELLADAALPRPPSRPLVGRAKDVAAGGVLVAALTAAAIGACVLVPHVLP